MPDTAWQFSAETPQESVQGWSQGAIMNYKQGKLAVFGEAAMFTAQTVESQNLKVGFIDPHAPQNAAFLLNIIHWLDPELKSKSQINNDKSIDSLYQQFSKAYETLDVDIVANLYTEDANYLPANSNQAVLTSRAEIRESFSTFFEWNKNNNRDLNISFRIIKRGIDDSLAYDVGYYLIKSKPQDKEEFPEDGNVGKFVVAVGLQPDGSWKFLLDGFSPAPFNAFYADSTAHNPLTN